MKPRNVVVMKGGPHVGSGWREIVEWQTGDLHSAGVTYWG